MFQRCLDSSVVEGTPDIYECGRDTRQIATRSSSIASMQNAAAPYIKCESCTPRKRIVNEADLVEDLALSLPM